MTTSLDTWIDCQYPYIREDFFEFDVVEGCDGKQFKWKKARISTPHYTWNRSGQSVYVKWLHARMTDACIDLVPGADTLAMADNATWFEWDDGSHLFALALVLPANNL